MAVSMTKESARRKIRGTYTPGNNGKGEAYEQLRLGKDPAEVLRDFKWVVEQLVREENDAAERSGTRLQSAPEPAFEPAFS